MEFLGKGCVFIIVTPRPSISLMYIFLIAEYCIEVVNAIFYIYILGLKPLSKPARAEMQSIVISLVLGARYTKR